MFANLIFCGLLVSMNNISKDLMSDLFYCQRFINQINDLLNKL